MYDSLIPDPFCHTLEQKVTGDKKQKREALLRYMDYSIIEGELFGKAHFLDHLDYGVSVWSKPLEPKDEVEKNKKKEDFMLNFLGQDAFHYYKSVIDFMSRESTGLIPFNSWYLSIVGLKPSHQNKGHGKTLITPILEKTLKIGAQLKLQNNIFTNREYLETLKNRKQITIWFHLLPIFTQIF